jgi:hypothetical protein
MAVQTFANPFRPGAGHMPPYLAGRDEERREFSRLLEQDTILSNLVLTGLRGVGKTVLLETLKPTAQRLNWLWAGSDLSETASITEANLATRIITDLAVVVQPISTREVAKRGAGFTSEVTRTSHSTGFTELMALYESTPGLPSDKLKAVLMETWPILASAGATGLVFAYDEAQNLSDHAAKEQYPLSLLLDVFQSLQRKGARMMLALTGLPTLVPKLVESRTYSERMFRVLFLNRLTSEESREAIVKPIEDKGCPVRLSTESVDTIINLSGGYPYFIQFICREVYDAFIQKLERGEKASVPQEAIVQKLDTDFFAGRWARATDRQRELLSVIAWLPNCDGEFSTQDVVLGSQIPPHRAFSSSHVNQMLGALGEQGLVYKNRHGKYSFAVPMLSGFIRRQQPLDPIDRTVTKPNT